MSTTYLLCSTSNGTITATERSSKITLDFEPDTTDNIISFPDALSEERLSALIVELIRVGTYISEKPNNFLPAILARIQKDAWLRLDQSQALQLLNSV